MFGWDFFEGAILAICSSRKEAFSKEAIRVLDMYRLGRDVEVGDQDMGLSQGNLLFY